MEEDQQNQNKNEKPRYYATDFNEIKENLSDEEKLLFERYKQMLSGIIPADSASSGSSSTANDASFATSSAPANGASSSSSAPSNDAPPLKYLLNHLKDISQKTMKLMAGGKLDIRVTCPKCGKRHCFIKVDNGLTHCWSCNWSGYLEEMKSLLGKGSGKVNGNYYANAQKKQQDEHKAKDYVPMLPDDFLEIDAENRSWLYPIYPFRTQEEQQQFIDHFHPANLLSRHPKARPLISATELASLQSMVQRYIQAMKLSPDIIIQEGVMCAWMKQTADDTKNEDPKGVEMVPAIAYCNYLDGKIINVKFRSVQQHPVTGEWSKLFCQVSPTKPCAPYGIDSINLLRPDAQPIRQLIITEGEKDRLTLMTCGFPYVLSIANGASTNIEESHEAFDEWIQQAGEIIICGDTDRPGRRLVKLLIEQYQTRAKVTTLPQGKKDISEVYDAFGSREVQRIIAEAQGISDADIYDLSEHKEDILDIMMGNYDRGYEVGMGGLTDGIFHPTSEGGLIILTGRPNSGKTDFLNCLMAHLMYHNQKRVAFFSFEKPIKGKHVREIARIALGVRNTEDMDGAESPEEARQENRRVLDFLSEHMVDFDTKTRLPDSNYIIGMMEAMMNRKKQKIDYLVIDPYVFINMTEGGSRATETEKVRLMLTKLQAWSRTRHIWTVVVAHPRIQYKDGHEAFPPLDIYSVAGSAQWANLADFLLTVNRISKPEEGKMFTIVEMLKVRDQEFCHPGKVYYVRQPCGRYDERESENDCIAEAMQGKVLAKDDEPWR
jgi:twinkle protein